MKLEDMMQCAPDALKFLKVMANEKRLFILCNLLDGEMSVTELAESVQLGQSALSQHLAILRKDGFVNTRKSSKTVYYSLHSEESKQMLELLHKLFSANCAS